MAYIYIFATILLTACGQLIFKWRIEKLNDTADKCMPKVEFVWRLISDPYIIGGFVAAFIAAICWILTLSKFALSYAYPFMGLTYVVVIGAARVFLNESLSISKMVGISLIVAGVVVLGQSKQ